MKLAVMQPYIFPYIGYFQLIKAVDTFVFYDDVNFIKQGWINRNQTLVNNQPNLFTIPLKKVSSFKLIKETEINDKLYPKWKKKFLKKIQQNYSKAPFFQEVYSVIEKVFSTPVDTISDLAILSVKETSHYLDLDTIFKISSEEFSDFQDLERTKRLLEINKKLNTSTYINPIGGQELYCKEEFKSNNIDLLFLQPSLKPYSQFNQNFISGLSIIDVMMFNSKNEISELISNGHLL